MVEPHNHNTFIKCYRCWQEAVANRVLSIFCWSGRIRTSGKYSFFYEFSSTHTTTVIGRLPPWSEIHSSPKRIARDAPTTTTLCTADLNVTPTKHTQSAHELPIEALTDWRRQYLTTMQFAFWSSPSSSSILWGRSIITRARKISSLIWIGIHHRLNRRSSSQHDPLSPPPAPKVERDSSDRIWGGFGLDHFFFVHVLMCRLHDLLGN